MPAYSYKRRFVAPIWVGLGLPIKPVIGLVIAAGVEIRPKRQTIRADRARHARPGEIVQHYCGMRTKSCFKIGEGRCTFASPIKLIMTPPGQGGCMADVWRHHGGNRIVRTCYTGDDFDSFDIAASVENELSPCVCWCADWCSWGVFNISWVQVHPTMWRRGIGSALVSEALRQIMPQGRLALLSTSKPDFYAKRWGFKPMTDYRSQFVYDGNERETLMGLEL